jgi:cell division protein FtsB
MVFFMYLCTVNQRQQAMKFKKVINYFSKLQWLLLAAIVAMAFFVSDITIIDRVKADRRIARLNSEIDYYNRQFKKDSAELADLLSSKNNLEKFAREQYHFKKQNEDVFIIEDR